MTSVAVEDILSRILADDHVSTLPNRLCEACVQELPVRGGGMSLIVDAVPKGAVAVTDDLAATLEDLQLTMGEGPGVDACRLGRPVLQPELHRTGPRRWAGFAPAALTAGVCAMFAFPLQIGGISLGALNLYRDRPGAMASHDLDRALIFADAATAVLLHLQRQMPSDGLHPDLTDPNDRSALVHQATGMIAVQAEVDLGEALLLLRARAYATEQTALQVARAVLARTLRFSPEYGHDG